MIDPLVLCTVGHAYTSLHEHISVLINELIVLRLLFVCLFSWRYNPLWLYFHSPVAGLSLLVFEVS